MESTPHAAGARREWALEALKSLTPPPRSLTAGRQVAIGLTAAVLGFAVRILLQPLLGGVLLFVSFYPAIAIAGWIGGLRAALVGTLASALLAGFFLLKPAFTIAPDDLVALALFAVSAAAVGVLGWRLRVALAGGSRSRRRAAVLLAAAHVLRNAADSIDGLDAVVDIIVPGFADWCTVDLFEVARFPVMRASHRDPSLVPGAYDLRHAHPLSARRFTDGSLPPALVRPNVRLRLGPADFDELPTALAEIARQFGARSLIAAPVTSQHGQVVGRLAVGMSEGDRDFEPEDVAACLEIANQLAAALDRLRQSRARDAGSVPRVVGGEREHVQRA